MPRKPVFLQCVLSLGKENQCLYRVASASAKKTAVFTVFCLELVGWSGIPGVEWSGTPGVVVDPSLTLRDV
jgi:hypothetical protein